MTPIFESMEYKIKPPPDICNTSATVSLIVVASTSRLRSMSRCKTKILPITRTGQARQIHLRSSRAVLITVKVFISPRTRHQCAGTPARQYETRPLTPPFLFRGLTERDTGGSVRGALYPNCIQSSGKVAIPAAEARFASAAHTDEKHFHSALARWRPPRQGPAGGSSTQERSAAPPSCSRPPPPSGW